MTPDTVEIPRVEGPAGGLGGHWRIIVTNDNHNTFEGVAAALSSVLPGVGYDQGMTYANIIHGPVRRSYGAARRSWPSTTGSS